MAIAVQVYPFLMFVINFVLYLKFHNAYRTNKNPVNNKDNAPENKFINNTNAKNVTNAFTALFTTQLLKARYHLHFISRFVSCFLSDIKYPGVHINKNANGMDAITCHLEMPN
jgi:hypothetical protein